MEPPVPGSPGAPATSFNTTSETEIAHTVMQTVGQVGPRPETMESQPFCRGFALQRMVKVTRLAHGVPVGGELDYLDEGTLAAAIRSRTPF